MNAYSRSSERRGGASLLARVAALAWAACFAFGTQAQTNPIRELPKDAKTGYLTHLKENAFTLDGQRVVLAPGGMIRGANNLILTPSAVPRESLVSYTKDAEGNLSRAWVLTKDEAAKSNVGFRFPWQTSPETGTPMNQVLPAETATPQRGAAPGFTTQSGSSQSGSAQSGTSQPR